LDSVIEEFKKRHWKSIYKKKNVHGFSGILRPRIKNGKELPGTSCVRIYVEKKEPFDSLAAKDIIPRHLDIGNNVVETDVVELERMYYVEELPCRCMTVKTDSPNDHQKRYRPLVAGISCIHRDGTACTLNWFYEKDGKILIGLNNHCGSLSNKARIGDEWLQPSPYDNGTFPNDIVARLTFYVETKFAYFNCKYRNFLHRIYRIVTRNDAPVNYVDISFGKPTVNYELRILGIDGEIVAKGEHKEGATVIKSGRTTGVTYGTIQDAHYNGYVYGSRGIAYYEDVVLCLCECAGGDSGSPVVTPLTDDKHLADGKFAFLGALFAGSDQGHMIYCKHQRIEQIAKVKVVLNK